MPYTPNSVVAQKFSFPDFTLTMNISGSVTAADVGKAVALDATADNTVKLAGDGDDIIGRLTSFEDRTQEGLKVGAVELKFVAKLPIKSGLSGASAVVRGSSVVGAGNGEVKARVVSSAATPDIYRNYVIAVANGFATVVQV